MDAERMKRRAKIKGAMVIKDAQQRIHQLQEWFEVVSREYQNDPEKLVDLGQRFESRREELEKRIHDANRTMKAIRYDEAHGDETS